MAKTIYGINGVIEALRQGMSIVELFVAPGKKAGRLQEILDLARARDIPIRFKDRIYLNSISKTSSHQGIVAVVSRYSYSTIEQLTEIALSQQSKALLVVADHIMDPGNLGSLIRTAEFFGAQGLVIPRDRAAPITDIVHKRSAGGTVYLPVAQVVNLARCLGQMADAGIWIVGAEGTAETPVCRFDWDRHAALVLGSEGKGLSRIVRERCHDLVRIPRLGRIESLNVSVAGGIILYEILRQRDYSR
ncbi:MAG: 23S rRNA (guanosine(2251)-2'-O)-methyltransferase RlmB [Thermodesulfobacteriota bacterium]